MTIRERERKRERQGTDVAATADISEPGLVPQHSAAQKDACTAMQRGKGAC